MDAHGAVEKAKNILRETGADLFLIKLFCAVEHYPRWKENQPTFETELNFGIENVRAAKKCLENSSSLSKREVEFVEGEIGGVPFSIGGDETTGMLPDGEGYGFQNIYLFLQGELVLDIEYADPLYDDPPELYSLPQDFRLTDVREFHWSQELLHFLERSNEMIDVHKAERERRRIEAKNKNAEGKFSF